ncbi:MAG: hypothetical protein AAF378_06700 [Cyanobacteria bacterium P01_A01_bin.84]
MQSFSIDLLFGVIWHNLVEGIIYEGWQKGWTALIAESKNNQKIPQYLNLALNKSFLEAQKNIAEKCREELVKNSTSTHYRGSITYHPPENDRDILNLENKIKILKKQLKQINKKISSDITLSLDKLEYLLELYNSNHQSSEEAKKYQDQIFQEVQKDCEVNSFKTALKNNQDGLCKKIYNYFLKEIEHNTQLNNIFNIYLLRTIDQIIDKGCESTHETSQNSQLTNSKTQNKIVFQAAFKPLNYIGYPEFNQDLDIVLEKSFLEAQKTIAEKCREKIIKISTIATAYRGAITYHPPENDMDIKNIENKIAFLNKQLKEVSYTKIDSEVIINFDSLEDLLKLYKSNHQSSGIKDTYIDKIFQEAEKNCDVETYKNTLRDQQYGLFPEVYKKFYRK